MATQLEPDARADENAFRTEVREFIAANFPEELKNKGNALAGVEGPSKETPAQKAWREAVGERGWGTPTWPKEYGGGGLNRKQAAILNEELARAGAYNPIGGMGVMMFGPTLIEYGTEELKRQHLPGIVTGSVRWCQGYSEPGSGSDLASLRSTARRDDERGGWVLNGQKTWSSRAALAHWGFGLFRSDPQAQKHAGLTYFLFPLDAEGITVRPIAQLDGEAGFAEIFFEDVFVPDADVLGGVGDGWRVAMSTAGNERGLSLRSPGRFTAAVDRLIDLHGSTHRGQVTDRVVDAEARFKDRVGPRGDQTAASSNHDGCPGIDEMAAGRDRDEAANHAVGGAFRIG